MPSDPEYIFRDLCAPFDQVKTRPQGGRQLSYITARQVMNRLDDVLGPANWWDDYVPLEKSVVCRLSIRLADGQILTKADAGGHAGMSDEGDDEKSGYSDAFKRAAVKFGVGRYLYQDGVPQFAGKGVVSAPRQTPTTRAAPAPTPSSTPSRSPEAKQAPDFRSLPKAGTGASFYFFKNLSDHFGANIVKNAEDLATAEKLPKSFKDWDQASLDKIALRAVAYCKRLLNYQGELDHLGASTPPPEGKAGDPFTGARGNLYIQCVLLFQLQHPGEIATDKQVDDLIVEFSDGKIEHLHQCNDPELLSQTAQTVKSAKEAYQASRK